MANAGPAPSSSNMPSSRSPTVLASRLTPPGRGALAVVGVAGAGAALVVDRAFAARGGRPVAAREDGVHCHGGVAAAAAVVASLIALGAEEAPWPRWLAAVGASESVVEAHESLARAGGPKSARILARQAAGTLDAEVARIEGLRDAGDHAAADESVARLLRAARVGLRLARPWRVVVAGPVNAGKSSLVNALAGHSRCIVSTEPGTTRDLVETRIVLDGWEVELVDTAGLRGHGDAPDPVERAGIARAESAAAGADLVLRVWPGNAGPLPTQPGELLVVSKIDVWPTGCGWPVDAMPTSAVTGAGIADLAAAIVARLVPEDRTEPDLLAGAVPFTPRQVAFIRGLTRPAASPSSSGRG